MEGTRGYIVKLPVYERKMTVLSLAKSYSVLPLQHRFENVDRLHEQKSHKFCLNSSTLLVLGLD